MHYFVCLLIVVGSFISQNSLAKEVAIFDSRKSLTLSKDEPVYKDFYINAGTEIGLRPGALVTVIRNSSLYDAYQNKSPGDLTISVGQVLIIHAQKGLSVGRLHKVFSRESRPVLEYDYIMVGDRLDISTITRLKEKSASKKVQEKAEKKNKLVDSEEKLESTDFASSQPPPDLSKNDEPTVMPSLQ